MKLYLLIFIKFKLEIYNQEIITYDINYIYNLEVID